MSTFITRLDAKGTGPTLAIKDLIDVAGVPTTVGSRVFADEAIPAEHDAPLLEGARKADARIVGKANLFELAFGASGVNEWFGTPKNPLDDELIPGGSSSGSAVAVANGDATIAYGSDSGGSVRVPSAFCGTVGLKTTFGRIPLTGVFPLSSSLDTVGPMARTVADVALAMSLLEPGFFESESRPSLIGRINPIGVEVDPVVNAAIDKALSLLDIEIVDIVVDGWRQAFDAGNVILISEAARTHRSLMADATRREKLSEAVRLRLIDGAAVSTARIEDALVVKQQFDKKLRELFDQVPLLALPSVGFFPPPLTEWREHVYTELTMPFNLAGVPALSIPVRSTSRLPASIQIVAPWGAEELLISAGRVFESAAGTQSD